jgi:hypothetical protein
MTTQRQLTCAEYIDMTDDYSSAIKVLLTAFGAEDDAGSAAEYATLVRDTVTAFALEDEAQLTADLIDAAITVVATMEAETQIASRFASFNAAVRQHLGEDISAWLTAGAAGVRVSHWWKRGGDTNITPANVFPPETIALQVAVTGSGTRTLTAGTAVNTVKFGGGQICARVTDDTVGAADIVMSVTGVDSTGAARTWTGTIPSGSTVGTEVNLTGTGSDAAVSASNCTFTGGTNLDDFDLVILEDRATP